MPPPWSHMLGTGERVNLPSSPILHAAISTIYIQENSFSLPSLNLLARLARRRLCSDGTQPRHKEQKVSQHSLVFS